MNKLNINTGIGADKIYTGITYTHTYMLSKTQITQITQITNIPTQSINSSYSDTFFFLPEKLNLEELLKENGIKERYLFHYAFIISSIYLGRVLNKKIGKGDFVPINVDVARTIISQRKTVKILRDLEKWNVIECDHTKQIKKKSFGYRLNLYNSSYSDTFRKILVTDKLITKKMNNWKIKQKKEAQEAGEDYFHLYNFVWQIEIKYKEALEFLNSNYVPFTDEYEARKLMIELIKEKDIFFKVDKKGQRAHTNLTNLASDLRQFITYKGKKLAQVDLKNSQPFLFNFLIKDKIDYSNDAQVQEYNKFKKLTEEGKFYEFLMDAFGIENDEKKRKEFKVLFFGRVFFDVNRKELKKEEKLFQSLFPTIFGFIREYKQEDYTNLAIKLQRAESKIIINDCVRRIRTERPDMFVSTIHDSIVVEPWNLVYVQEVIEDAFVKHNLKPGTKCENF